MKRVITMILAVLLLMSALPMSALAATKYTVYISSTGSGTLNLRSGPGKDYDVKGYVSHGDRVTLLDEEDEWSEVRTASGRTGWIKTKYIDGTTRSLGSGYKYVKTNGGSINLRTGAGTGYGVKGSVANGAKVKVLNTEDSWARVTVQSSGATGWIMAKYLSDTAPGGGSSSSEGGSAVSGGAQQVYRVTSSTLNVRAGAGTGYALRATLYAGRAFRVLGSSGNWFRISTLTGNITGWVSKTYTAAGATATVTAGSLNMRASASSSGRYIKSLPAGARVNVLSVTGNWARVTHGGNTGYVSMSYLRF